MATDDETTDLDQATDVEGRFLTYKVGERRAGREPKGYGDWLAAGMPVTSD